MSLKFKIVTTEEVLTERHNQDSYEEHKYTTFETDSYSSTFDGFITFSVDSSYISIPVCHVRYIIETTEEITTRI